MGMVTTGARIPLALAKAQQKVKKVVGKKGPLAKVAGAGPKLVGALKKEAKLGPVLHQEALGALAAMKARDPSLEDVLKKAHGYAVFPTVGKASVVLGAGFGIGEVFEQGRVVGYAGLVQVTLGVQLGGQTFKELVIFENKGALDRFKASNVSFSANASVAFAKGGAARTRGPGMRAIVHSEGGMMLELGLGGQKFIFKPAGLGRLKTAPPQKPGASEASKLGQPAGPPH